MPKKPKVDEEDIITFRKAMSGTIPLVQKKIRLARSANPYEQIKKPKYQIIMQEFYGESNKIRFKLKETRSETVVVKTAGQIMMDKDLINNLSKDDIKSISYIAGYECSNETSS